MATSTANIRQGAGYTGGLSAAVAGTTLPTDATTALAAAYKDLGGITDDGITRNPSISTNDQRLRDGSLGRRFIASSETTWGVTFVESNPNTFAYYFPGSTQVTTTGVNKQSILAPISKIAIWVFDTLDNGIHTRVILPRAEVVDFGPEQFFAGGARVYQLTIAAYNDASGFNEYRYTDDPAFP